MKSDNIGNKFADQHNDTCNEYCSALRIASIGFRNYAPNIHSFPPAPGSFSMSVYLSHTDIFERMIQKKPLRDYPKFNTK